MKRIKYCFCCIFALVFLLSCKDSGNTGGIEDTGFLNPKGDALSYIKDGINANNESNDIKIAFDSSSDWTAALFIDNDEKNNAEWCKIDKTSGVAGTNVITLHIDYNNTLSERNANLIVNQGALNFKILISQEKSPWLMISENEIQVSCDETVINFTVEFNLEYNCEIDEASKDWIDYVGTRAVSTKKESIVISENQGGKREGFVHINSVDGKISKTVIIEQEAHRGSGTKDDPFSISGLINYASTLEQGQNSPEPKYFKGIVVSITEAPGNMYGTATFYISDDRRRSNLFYVYRCQGPGNKKFTPADEGLFVEGDELVICGTITNYNGTLETVPNQVYIVSINGNELPVTPDEPVGDGTLNNPFNVAGIIAYTSALPADQNSSKEVYFTGTVESFKSGEEPGNPYGNATFYIKDDSTYEKFHCFRVMGPGNQKFTSADQLKVGDKVTICGLVVNYKGYIPETVTGKAYCYSINGETTPSNPGTDPGTEPGDEPGYGVGVEAFTNGDFETWDGSTPVNWKSACTASTATLEQSTDTHGGSYAVVIKGTTTSNKRLAYKELTLEAGMYTFSVFAKATSNTPTQIRMGYVPVTAGAVGSYVYNASYNDINTEWGQCTFTFELKEKTTICLVVMNPKKSSYSSGEDVLIDDASFVKW